MANLIPIINKDDLDLLASDEVKQLKSCEIFYDGKYLGTLIIPPEKAGPTICDNIRTKAEYLGVQSNSVGGVELSKIKVLA